MILIRLIGVLAFLVIAVGIWMAVVSGQFGPMPANSLPGGFKGRVLAMEFVATEADVEQILSPDVSHNRDVMQKVITIDFLWLVCYGLLFAAISFLLAKRNCPWARYLSVVALVAGLGAAAFDIRENLGILKALDCSPCSHILINNINDAALLKWTMSFVAMALLAIAFQDLANRFANWISFSFIVTALIGFAGLWKHTLLFLIPIPLLIGLALLVVTAFVWPRKLKESTC
jgi:hypothetical protein